MKQKLEINKDNYKGYVKLYELLNYGSTNQLEITKDFLKKSIPSLALVGIGMVTLMINYIFLLNQLLTYTVIGLGIGIEIVNMGSYIKKLIDDKKKDKDYIKNKYPYVNFEIKNDELEDALLKSKILRYNKSYVTLDVEGYENYLETEEIKNEIFKQNSYEKYTPNKNEVPEIKLDKQKVKTLVRNYK